MCVESHLRELLAQGFEVAVAKDATAAPKHPECGYGYTAALINYAYLAHAVWPTDEVVKAMERAARSKSPDLSFPGREQSLFPMPTAETWTDATVFWLKRWSY
jgi:hypothetical protein